MNILQINAMDLKGGAAKVSYSLHKEFEKRGHSSSICVVKKFSNDSNVFQISKQWKFAELIEKQTGRNIERFLRAKARAIFPTDMNFFNNRYLFQSEEFKKADIIHCHNLHSMYFNLRNLIKISKIKPVIWTFHDMWPITPWCAYSFSEPLKNGFFGCRSDLENHSLNYPRNNYFLTSEKKWIYGKSKFHVVTPSRWLKEQVEKSVLNGKKISVIHNGIDTNVFKPQNKIEARKKVGLDQNKKIIIFAADGGSGDPRKGWKYIEKTINHFEDRGNFIFLCIGGKNINKKENKQIKFVDHINNESLLSLYYSASDLLLFPSLAENFSMIILEAMSSGLPIVSFDTGGVKEAIIHKTTGYVAKYLDQDDFIEGVKLLLTQSEKETAWMSEKSIERVRNNFTVEKMADQYLDIYEETIKEFRQKNF